jgi:hypothetical protein
MGATFWEEGLMAHFATQTASISGNGTGVSTNRAAKAGVTPAVTPPAVDPNREKALQILSKSIYKELRENGYQPKQIVALATEIISLVTTDIGDGPLT